MEKEYKQRAPHVLAEINSTPDVRTSASNAANVNSFSATKTTMKNGKITNEERQRRMKLQLCLYCGDPGHKLNECPKKKGSKKPSPPSAAAVAGDPSGSQQ